METSRDSTSTILIIGLIVVGVILLLCVCGVIGLAVLTLLGPAIGNVIVTTPMAPVP